MNKKIDSIKLNYFFPNNPRAINNSQSELKQQQSNNNQICLTPNHSLPQTNCGRVIMDYLQY